MKNINATLSLLFLFCIFTFSLYAQAPQLNTAKLDSFFNVLSENNKVMGSFAIARNGEIIYQKTMGYRLIEGDKRIPATSETQYRIGSVTKTFTATMIFQLIDEKKLSLDTKLSGFFPEMPNATQITIAQLLNHTSGLADHVNENLEWIVSPHTKAELLEKISKVKPQFEPGAKQAYSNGNYLILGYILEKITGKTYPEALKTRILDKIGLKHTIAGTVNNSQKLEARSYKQMAGWNPVTDIYFPDVVGVGDILSTPQDLLTFIQALMSGKLTSAESLSKMKSFEGPQTLAMGLLRMPFYGKTVIGHNGGTFGTYSGMYAIPEDGLSFALCINGLSYNMNDILIAMLSSYYNQPYKIPVINVVELKPEDLDGLLGNYTSQDLPLKIAVTRSGAMLVVQATGQPSFPLDAVTKDEFKNEGLGAVLKFDREKHEMTLIQHGKNFHYVIEK